MLTRIGSAWPVSSRFGFASWCRALARSGFFRCVCSITICLAPGLKLHCLLRARPGTRKVPADSEGASNTQYGGVSAQSSVAYKLSSLEEVSSRHRTTFKPGLEVQPASFQTEVWRLSRSSTELASSTSEVLQAAWTEVWRPFLSTGLARRPQRRLTSSVGGSVETFVVFLQACHGDLRRSYRQHTAWMWHELPVDIEREGGDDRYFLVAEILQELSFSGDAPSRGLEVARYASSHRVRTFQCSYLNYGCGCRSS